MRVSHVALDGCEVLPHGVDVVPVPLVLVVGGELQNSDDLVDFVAHPRGKVVAVFARLVNAAATAYVIYYCSSFQHHNRWIIFKFDNRTENAFELFIRAVSVISWITEDEI